MHKIFSVIVRIILESIVVIFFILATTFGWLPSKSYRGIQLNETEKDLRDYMRTVVNQMSDKIGIRNYQYYDNLEKAKKYISNEFEQLGYVVKYQSYSIGGQRFDNIIASRSTSFDSKPLIIGAHYDSCFNPGADDNGSGIAGILGLAKLFSNTPVVKKLIFVAFVNEEPPFFHTQSMGSRVYNRELKAKEIDIEGAIILEMIGYYSESLFSQKYLPLLGPFYPNKGNFIGVVGDFNSAYLVKNLKREFRKNTAFPIRTIVAPGSIPGINFSDNWSFWQEGFPAVMITGTAYLRNPHYHKQSDLSDTLNYDYMTVVLYSLKNSIETLLTDK